MAAPTASDPREQQATRLRRFHDALADSPLAGRYWMCGGLLLGWAREGHVLGHDTLDADFNYLAQDEERLRATLPILADAGFALVRRFPSVTAEVPTEWSVGCDGAQFEFFRVEIVDGRQRWSNYGTNTRPDFPHPHVQNICESLAQPLEEFHFLDRWWLKAADHEAELTALYGDWRTPDPGFDYMHATTIVQRRPWDPSGYQF